MKPEKSNLRNIVWLINGIMVFLLGLFVIYKILDNINWSDKDIHGGVIVGEEKEKAIEQNLILQTIKYSKPSSMLNTDYKLIRIDQTDFKIPKKVMEIARCANDFSYGVTINAIIFNEEKNDYTLILDRIACIKRIDAPFWKNDSSQIVIVYDITFYDSNNDGLINSQDIGEIYISDLDGSHFQRIAPDSFTTIDYEFTQDFKGIFLQCLKIEKDSSIPREHWIQISGYYDIDSRKFLLNSNINELVEKARQLLVN
jgi:hypothetical protein